MASPNPSVVHPFPGDLRPGQTHRLPVVDVTLLFADVVGSAEIVQRLGDRGAYSLIRQFCSVVREATLRCEGETIELRGDGALLVFSSPRAALACAIEIQERCGREGSLGIRIGLHSGGALRLVRGYFGQTLILAARIADQAQQGEILVSPQLLLRIGDLGSLRLGAQRSIELKGFPQPVLVSQIEWRPELQPIPLPLRGTSFRRSARAASARIG